MFARVLVYGKEIILCKPIEMVLFVFHFYIPHVNILSKLCVQKFLPKLQVMTAAGLYAYFGDCDSVERTKLNYQMFVSNFPKFIQNSEENELVLYHCEETSQEKYRILQLIKLMKCSTNMQKIIFQQICKK